ncbi:hypothetical protein ECTOBSL9_0939 [Ectothiorhodospira sp. BSL-9]|nr:hypothetical protein ECTOBSL9_0939 [Ectothiorhodospira sp. BSL-9]
MDLDPSLLDAVKKGKAIPIFGAGILHGAHFPTGKSPLLGEDLKILLSDHFLSGDHKNTSLAFVAELAVSQSDLFTLQRFVADQFSDIKPATFHCDLTRFNWRALFTTNYDLLIEESYKASGNPLQRCQPILSNFDPLDEIRRTDDRVPLYKLHGCVTRIRDVSLPLILNIEQYNDYLTNRDRLFTELFELAHENTLIFVGHSLQDADIREIIKRVDRTIGQGRPQYYLIKPGVKISEVNLWAQKRIRALNGTLEDFVTALLDQVPEPHRALSFSTTPDTHPIQSKFCTHNTLSEDILSFLTNDVQFIEQTLLTGTGTPQEFYRGHGQGWYPISENLDAPRTICRKLLADAIVIAEANRTDSADLFVIKGEAGSGKSVLLRRLAWDAGIHKSRICFYVSGLSSIDPERLEELHANIQERLFIFVDNAAQCICTINRLIKFARIRSLPITIITAERYTEWNDRCSTLDELVTAQYKLPYLGPDEIDALVTRLEKYDCLGEALLPLTHKERVQRFQDAFGRQLLVALHEVTMGRPFEDIIYDEYRSIRSDRARSLYRTVCILNRHRVPVRAGLIHRVFDIDWNDFQSQFLKPLEKVVIASGHGERDLHYAARHPEIADIVFQRAYDSVQDRYHEYVRVLSLLNISYQSDRTSFRSMIRAKTILDLFPDSTDVQRIYDTVLECVGRDPYVLQQIANFERLRDNGNLRKAIDFLNEASNTAPKDGSILHSLATTWRDRAKTEADPGIRDQYRAEARATLERLLRMDGHSAYTDSGIIDLAIDDVRDAIADSGTADRTLDHLVRNAEKAISESRRRFPSEGHLPALEATFAELLADTPRAVRALETACGQDPSDPFLAIRLSTIYRRQGRQPEAKSVLERALDSRRSDHRLNFFYADLLRGTDEASPKLLSYYFRRSFTPGDSSYEAQFWYSRFAIESDDATERKAAGMTFSALRRAKVPQAVKSKIRDYHGGENPIRHRGRLTEKRGAYGFVNVRDFDITAFIHEEAFDDGLWELVSLGEDLKFNIGFAYTGLVCTKVELA